MQLTSPHSHRAVSLQERQMEILREKNKGLELRLADLVRHGHDNDRTQQRMHAWQLRLLAEADSHALPYAVQDGLQQVFDVPAVALRLWDVAEQYVHMEVAQGAAKTCASLPKACVRRTAAATAASRRRGCWSATISPRWRW